MMQLQLADLLLANIELHACCPLALAGVPAAVALSQATMCAAAFSGAVASGFSSHPDDPKKPIVDYDLALILSPGMLMGSSIGASHASLPLAVHSESNVWQCSPQHVKHCI